MVTAGTIITIGLVGAFLAFGGASLVKPAIDNAKSTKTSLVTKINDTKNKLKEGAKSG